MTYPTVSELIDKIYVKLNSIEAKGFFTALELNVVKDAMKFYLENQSFKK